MPLPVSSTASPTNPPRGGGSPPTPSRPVAPLRAADDAAIVHTDGLSFGQTVDAVVAIIREVAPIVGGGGGGKDAMARAGGKDPSRLAEALDAARAVLTASRGA